MSVVSKGPDPHRISRKKTKKRGSGEDLDTRTKVKI